MTKKVLYFILFFITTTTILAQDYLYNIELTNLSYDVRRKVKRKTSSYISIKIYYEGGSKEIYRQKLGYGSKENNLFLPPIRINKKPLSIHVKGFVNFKVGTDAHYEENIPLNLCPNQYFEIDTHSPRMTNITFRINVTPSLTLKSISTSGKSNSYLPIDSEILLVAKEGFDRNLYKFQYEHPIYGWRDFTSTEYISNWISPHIIRTSAKKIFKEEAEKMIGKTINFRVLVRGGESCPLNNVIPLTVTQAAPFITIKNIQSPLCNSNETTATVTIQLSRKLLGSLEQYKKNREAYLGEVFNGFSFIKAGENEKGGDIDGLPKDLTEYFLQHDHIDNVVLRTASVTTNYQIDIMGKFYYLNNNGQRKDIPLYTDDAQHKGIFTITVPKPLTASAFPTDNKCFGDTKGKIEVRVLGGTPPYKYVKNDEPPVTVGGNSFFLTNLPTGTYTLTITDKNDCQILKNGKVSPVVVKIGGPAKPITIVNEGKVNFITHAKGYKRKDGMISAIITGGTPIDSYRYTTQLQASNGEFINTLHMGTGEKKGEFLALYYFLGADTYTLTIKDRNGCTLTKKITITEPDELIINSIEATPISCNPRNSDPNNNSSINSNGTLTVNAKGGVPTYRYVWKRFNKPYTETRNKTITDLVDGIYQVEVIDANENKAVGTYTLTYPDPLYLKVTKSEMTCSAPNGGQATAIASGGTPPYTYLWNTGHTGAHITGLSAGKYFVTVSDSRGCSVQEKVVLSYPEEVEVNNAIITSVTCYEGNDGKIALTLSGGKGAVNVLWYDADGTLITQGTTNGGKTISGLKAGKYKAVFRDQSDCPALEQFYEVLQPEKTVINIPSQITICQGDSRSFDLSTAFPSATFRWTDSTGSLLSTEPTFTVSTKGNYKVEITDQKGCKEATTFEVSQSDKILEVDFLAATNSYYNYTVKLVSLSHSITTQWVLPQEVTLIKEENGGAEVRFPNEGTYTIGLKGFLDGCEKTVYKTLWVEKDRLGIGKENTSKEVLIDDFGIFSNPNNGTFRIKVNLKRASAIKVYCIDILGREAFPAIEQPEGTTFDIPIENRRISAGQYLVILEAGGDVMVQKMIVNH
jgi:PKD domain containing protein